MSTIKKRKKREQLEKQFRTLLKESSALFSKDRHRSDEIRMQAEEIWRQIEEIDKGSSN